MADFFVIAVDQDDIDQLWLVEENGDECLRLVPAEIDAAIAVGVGLLVNRKVNPLLFLSDGDDFSGRAVVVEPFHADFEQACWNGRDHSHGLQVDRWLAYAGPDGFGVEFGDE